MDRWVAGLRDFSRFDEDLGSVVSLFRPFSEDELRNNAPQVVTCNEIQKEVSVSQTIAGKQIDRVFTFDKVAFLFLSFFFFSCGICLDLTSLG